jgi:hypothetical protein
MRPVPCPKPARHHAIGRAIGPGVGKRTRRAILLSGVGEKRRRSRASDTPLTPLFSLLFVYHLSIGNFPSCYVHRSLEPDSDEQRWWGIAYREDNRCRGKRESKCQEAQHKTGECQTDDERLTTRGPGHRGGCQKPESRTSGRKSTTRSRDSRGTSRIESEISDPEISGQ